MRIRWLILIGVVCASCSTAAPLPATAPPPTTPPVASTSTSSLPSPSDPRGLEAVIPGQNDLEADRINLIFAPWGWQDPDEFRRLVEAVVGFSGTVVGFDGDGEMASGDTEVVSGELGLFGVEPFRSNTHLFNVWITDIEPPGPALWLNTDDVPFDLPDASIITLAWDAEAAVPGITSVSGLDSQFSDPASLGRTGSDPFANVMVNVVPWNQQEALRLTVHELGHALFGLTDEYIGRIGGDGVPRSDAWPSCAQSLETAREWWSDDIGTYDPMIDIWIAEMEAAGLGDTFDADAIREENRTAYVEGGCFGDAGSYRSAEDTIMGFASPAFGVTNRNWAERVLAQWEG